MTESRLAISPRGKLVLVDPRPKIAFLDDDQVTIELCLEILEEEKIEFRSVSYICKDQFLAELPRLLPNYYVNIATWWTVTDDRSWGAMRFQYVSLMRPKIMRN